jgi:hypothetical protein
MRNKAITFILKHQKSSTNHCKLNQIQRANKFEARVSCNGAVRAVDTAGLYLCVATPYGVLNTIHENKMFLRAF